MPYVTDEQFAQAFGQGELDDLLAEGTDFTKVEAAAAGLIDGYLAARYPLPLLSVPEILRGWALDIVRFRLWDERAPEEVRRRYDDAVAQLRDLARGLIALPPDAAGNPPAAGVEFGGYSACRVFTADSLAGF